MEGSSTFNTKALDTSPSRAPMDKYQFSKIFEKRVWYLSSTVFCILLAHVLMGKYIIQIEKSIGHPMSFGLKVKVYSIKHFFF